MKVSILTAGFNAGKFIAQYYESLIKQTCRDFEIVFVDDCSTDKTRDVIKSYGMKNIKYIRNSKRLFCSSSYNIAMKAAEGEICCVVDADDALSKRAVERIILLYEKYPKIDFIYTQHLWCDQRLQYIRKGLSRLPAENHSILDMVSKGHHCFSHWRTFRRELNKKTDIFPVGLKYAVDKNMGFALEEVGKGGFIAECFYYYRYYAGNMSKINASDQRYTCKELVKQYKKKRKEQNIKCQYIDLLTL